jgi:hypothetical protein
LPLICGDAPEVWCCVSTNDVMEPREETGRVDARNRLGTSRTLALCEVLDGRPSAAVCMLTQAMAAVLASIHAPSDTASSEQGAKRRRLGHTDARGDDLDGLVERLSRSPPALIAQRSGQSFANMEWRAAVELLLVSLACLPSEAVSAAPTTAVAQAEALARYLDAYDEVDATTVTGAFRRDYGGSAGCPDFAVAVMTVVRGLQSETEPGPRSLLSLTLRASRLFFAAEVRWRNS